MRTTRRLALALCTLALCSLSVAARPALRDAINEPGEDWQAKFGPELQRGNAKAEFTLVDAKGQELEQAELHGLRLHRKAGGWFESVEARFESSKVCCDGLASMGLDAGSYELELYLGVYGMLRHAFELKPGEFLKGELKTEVWRRIICLKFVDAKGDALPWLPAAPTYSYVRLKEDFSTRAIPARILRDPPSDGRGGRGGAGGFAYRRARGGGSKIHSPRYDTDEGCWHLRVFAGASGTVLCPLNEELLGKGELKFDGEFALAQWDEYKVELAPTEAYAEATDKRKALNDADPGARSILQQPVNSLPTKFDYRDESTIAAGCWRAVVKLDAALEITARIRAMEGHSAVTGDSVTRLRRDGSTIWFDLPDNCRAEFSWQSQLVMFQSESSLSVEKSNRITLVEPKFDLVAVEVAWPCETAKALTVCVNAWCDGAQNWFAWRRWDQKKPLTLYFERAFLQQQRARSLSLSLQQGTTLQNLATVLYGTVKLDEVTYKSLLDGNAKVEASWCGLTWRTVNKMGQPLPWVEGSLMLAHEAEVAIKARQAWLDVRAMRRAENASYVPNFEVERDETIAVLKDSGTIEWVERTGAWYNTHQRALVAGAGFGGFNTALTPGERYTLFLWSNSRDELKPDKRIDFVATGEMMDLGLITLPSYSK